MEQRLITLTTILLTIGACLLNGCTSTMNASRHILSANLHMKDKNYDSAMSECECENAISLAPNYSKAYTCRGRVFGLRGDVDVALQDFDRAVELDPNTMDPYFPRIAINFERKNYDQREIRVKPLALSFLKENLDH